MLLDKILEGYIYKQYLFFPVFLKKDVMKRDTFAVYVTSLVLVLYALVAYSEFSYRFVFLIFTISPVLILWMVYTVLKSPDEPTRTFDDYFYMDSDKRPMKRR